MGFFGKGCLSKGRPSFSSRKLPLLYERQWKRRKLWMDQLLSFTSSSYFKRKSPGDKKEMEEKSQHLQEDNSKNIPTQTQPGNSSSDVSESIEIDLGEKNASDSDEDDCVMVIDDDESGEGESVVPNICRELVKTVVETLNLSLEEAFFLSYGVGCLQVVDLHGEFLSLDGMWQLYVKSQPDFISSYVVYHYYRSKGWVVKLGFTFGGKFILYKKGPPYHHASYIVKIQDVDKEPEDNSLTHRFTWSDAMGFNRLAETAGKEILYTHVYWPRGIPKEEFQSPKVISKFKVEEVLLRRWNYNQQRKEKETS